MDWIRWAASSSDCPTTSGSDCGAQTLLARTAKLAENTGKSLINSCGRRTRFLTIIQQMVNCTLSSFLMNISRSSKCGYKALFKWWFKWFIAFTKTLFCYCSYWPVMSTTLPLPFKRSQRFLLLMKTSFKNILWKHFIFLNATIWKYPDFLNALISAFLLLPSLGQVDTCVVQGGQGSLPVQGVVRVIAAMRYQMPVEREVFFWKSFQHVSCTFDAQWNNAGYNE